MPDDNGVFLAGPQGLGCPCGRCCRSVATLVNALLDVLPAAKVVAGNDGQVLVYAVFLDAGGKLGQVAQLLAGIVRVRMQLPDRDISDICHSDYSFLNSS